MISAFKLVLAILFFLVSAEWKTMALDSPEKLLAEIPGLFNTGLDDFSNLLPENSIDPHYELISSADKVYTGPDSKVVNYEGFPMNCWLPNSSRSQWIAPRSDAGEFNDAGIYVYRINFDLSKFKPSTAVITGAWSTDNNGVDILINGKSTGYFTPLEAFRYGMFEFEIRDGFKDGINSIDFVVHNYNAPTGIRVEIKGQAEPKEYVAK